ncbi:hypothetical protein EK21DRAFT_89740 [Setomelanomma holmii]|uniref:Uncharacterized protein n=1 Tax=Setomelanomma holmii TaxID=210430 RepID=A0A9P4H973_9PLEO|nr:hypothetical protein EK21DRAFT_89740 [Setomelanomma holmii]
MVTDPHFWKRFSVAVHEDEAAKKEMAGRPDLKHSYVPSSVSSTISSPSVLSPIDLSLVSAPASAVLPPPSRRREIWERDSWGPPAIQTQSEKTGETERVMERAQRPKRQPSKLQKSHSTRSTARLLPQQPPPAPAIEEKYLPPSPSHCHRRPSFRCPSSLSLSGRPRHFITWTTITANPDHRASWLESQKKKSRQRTWICWCFWLGIGVLVAGVVAAVLVLRTHHVF